MLLFSCTNISNLKQKLDFEKLNLTLKKFPNDWEYIILFREHILVNLFYANNIFIYLWRKMTKQIEWYMINILSNESLTIDI